MLEGDSEAVVGNVRDLRQLEGVLFEPEDVQWRAHRGAISRMRSGPTTAATTQAADA
jgi:hypothetical protein